MLTAMKLNTMKNANNSLRRDYNEKLKKSQWYTCILPIFLYGSECWAVTKNDVRKIDALDQWCLRMLLGINWQQHVRNDVVRRLTKQPHLSAIVQSRRLSLFGHIARMPDETDAKQILTASSAGNWRRPLGCPRIKGKKGKVHVLAIALLTCFFKTRSALQSWKWQLIGMS